MSENNLLVEVYFSTIMDRSSFEGEAVSVSSKNEIGDFDVLPQHSNFITLIFEKIIIKTPEGEEVDYEFERGVLEVSNNEVKIFLGL